MGSWLGKKEVSLPLEDLKILSEHTSCSVPEIKRMWTLFHKLKTLESGCMAAEDALKLPGLRNNPFGPRLVELCSSQCSGGLDFESCLQLFGVFHPRAPPEARVAWAFALWDFDGDGLLGASDLKRGLWLLANGSRDPPGPDTAADFDLHGGNPRMFEGEASASRGGRRESRREDLLSPQEISQVLHHLATEIEPARGAISFDEFKGIVARLPDFAAHFTLSPP